MSDVLAACAAVAAAIIIVPCAIVVGASYALLGAGWAIIHLQMWWAQHGAQVIAWSVLLLVLAVAFVVAARFIRRRWEEFVFEQQHRQALRQLDRLYQRAVDDINNGGNPSGELERWRP